MHSAAPVVGIDLHDPVLGQRLPERPVDLVPAWHQSGVSGHSERPVGLGETDDSALRQSFDPHRDALAGTDAAVVDQSHDGTGEPGSVGLDPQSAPRPSVLTGRVVDPPDLESASSRHQVVLILVERPLRVERRHEVGDHLIGPTRVGPHIDDQTTGAVGLQVADRSSKERERRGVVAGQLRRQVDLRVHADVPHTTGQHPMIDHPLRPAAVDDGRHGRALQGEQVVICGCQDSLPGALIPGIPKRHSTLRPDRRPDEEAQLLILDPAVGRHVR